MAEPQLIMAIGRIERALSRIEQAPRPAIDPAGDSELFVRHERLMTETKAAIADLDALIAGEA